MTSVTRAADVALRSFALDRNSPVPLYFQVAQHLEGQISSGAIPPGAIFENEISLADHLGLSRPTMRRAMQHLVDKGLVVRRRGVGTRVVQPKVRRPLELSSLYDDLNRTGQVPTTSVLTFEEVGADEVTAEKLAVEEESPVVRVVRLRSASERPIAKMTNYLPAAIVDFDAAALEEQGLYELLKLRSIVLHSATQVVGARNATAAEARLLQEPRGAALLTMQRQTFDDHGSVVEFGTHLYAASRYSFEISLLTT